MTVHPLLAVCRVGSFPGPAEGRGRRLCRSEWRRAALPPVPACRGVVLLFASSDLFRSRLRSAARAALSLATVHLGVWRVADELADRPFRCPPELVSRCTSPRTKRRERRQKSYSPLDQAARCHHPDRPKSIALQASSCALCRGPHDARACRLTANKTNHSRNPHKLIPRPKLVLFLPAPARPTISAFAKPTLIPVSQRP